MWSDSIVAQTLESKRLIIHSINANILSGFDGITEWMGFDGKYVTCTLPGPNLDRTTPATHLCVWWSKISTNSVTCFSLVMAMGWVLAPRLQQDWGARMNGDRMLDPSVIIYSETIPKLFVRMICSWTVRPSKELSSASVCGYHVCLLESPNNIIHDKHTSCPYIVNIHVDSPSQE